MFNSSYRYGERNTYVLPESGTRSEIKPPINFVYRPVKSYLCIVYLPQFIPGAPLVDHFNKPRSIRSRPNATEITFRPVGRTRGARSTRIQQT